jgi:predicted nucleic acid-binding Zn ribbon protein
MRPLAHIVPAALLQLLQDTPTSDGKIAFAWSAAVGPALARATRVKLEGGTLLVETSSPQWTREVRRSTAVILGRLQRMLGADTVTAIIVRS